MSLKILLALVPVALVAVAAAGWYALYPTKSWTLQLDGEASEDDVQLALDQVRTRVATECAMGCAVTRASGGRIRVAYPVLWSSEDTEGLLSVPGHFSMRLVEPLKAYESDSLPRDPHDLNLDPYFRPTSDVLVSNADIDDVAVLEDKEGYYLSIMLGTRAATAMQRATAGRLPQHLAMIMDGHVLSAPVIQTPLGNRIAWTPRAEARSGKQHLLQLALLSRLMKAAPMTRALRITRRPD